VTADLFCEFSQIPVSSCAHCRSVPHVGSGRSRAELLAEVTMGPWFTARRDGVCVWGCRIHVGDSIRADGQGSYLCTECGAS
jgi:hypothetical protein